MASIKLYTVIFVVLMGFSTAQALFEFSGILDEVYWIGLAAIMVFSVIKASFVAGWYMHLRDEPRAVTYLVLGGLLGVLALTAGAAYSIL